MIIQELKAIKSKLATLALVMYCNIVHLCHAYWDQDMISMIYNVIIVSLDNILAFQPEWGLNETAIICKDILSSLAFLYSLLEISHSYLTVKNIHLSLDSTVKIDMFFQHRGMKKEGLRKFPVNIRISMLKRDQNEDKKQDILLLAFIIKQLAEPDMVLKSREMLELEYSDEKDLLDFFEKMKVPQHASELLKVNKCPLSLLNILLMSSIA